MTTCSQCGGLIPSPSEIGMSIGGVVCRCFLVRKEPNKMSEELKKDPIFHKNYIEADQFHILQSENAKLKEMVERMAVLISHIPSCHIFDNIKCNCGYDKAQSEYVKWKKVEK